MDDSWMNYNTLIILDMCYLIFFIIHEKIYVYIYIKKFQCTYSMKWGSENVDFLNYDSSNIERILEYQ